VCVLLVIVIVGAATAWRIVPERERLVVFRLGRIIGARGPGLIFLLPFIDGGVNVDLRERVETIHAAQFLLHDRSTIQMDVTCNYRITDPVASVLNVADIHNALRQLARTTLQTLMAQENAGDVLVARAQLEQEAALRVREHVEAWGVAVQSIRLDNTEKRA
jgi:regulator of protease activity HflC (stomatin/prohibitin superfamily)